MTPADASGNDCGDDKAAEHSRDDYVVLMGGGGEGMTDEEANCISAAVVDVVGVDALEQANAWDKIQANPDGSLADYGVVVDEAQVAAIADGVGRVRRRASALRGDVRHGRGPVGRAGGVPGLRPRRGRAGAALAISLTQGAAALDADPTFTAGVEQAALDCTAQGIS